LYPQQIAGSERCRDADSEKRLAEYAELQMKAVDSQRKWSMEIVEIDPGEEDIPRSDG
jgi:hypothetical protein